MRFYITLFLVLIVSGCAKQAVEPVILSEFSIEGDWMRPRSDRNGTNLMSSTSTVKDDFLLYPQVDKRMTVTLKKKEVEELIAGLGLIPETLKAIPGLEEEYSRQLFSSTQNRDQRISVQLFKKPAGESEIVSTFRVKVPNIPNSLFTGFMILTPDKGMEWKKQLEKLVNK